MSKNAYITLLGRSSWAVINTYYSILKEDRFRPEIVYVFAEEPYKKSLDKVLEGLKILSEEFNIKTEIKSVVVGDAKFVSSGEKVYQKMEELINNDYKIALDITPGRKTLVVTALLSSNKFISRKKGAIRYIFYLAVDDPLEPKPFMMIPASAQILRDFYDNQQGEK